MKYIFILFLCCYTLCQQQPVPYTLGIENFRPEFLVKMKLTEDARIGLITNHTGKDITKKSSLDHLRAKGFKVAALFAPEHGYYGLESAGNRFEHSFDAHAKLPIYSLYNQQKNDPIGSSVFEKIDLLVFDVQDAGMRHYTYTGTLFHALQLAAAHKKPIIILDRPNPLGAVIEGPLGKIISSSFISSLPLRHGMTVGEIALFCNKYLLSPPAKIYVIPMAHFKRFHGLAHSASLPLSPNIQTHNALKGYSFLGLLGEIRPFDVGIGTKKAFERCGLPKKILSVSAWKQIALKLQTLGITTQFIQYTRRNTFYYGLEIAIDNCNECRSFQALLTILDMCKKEKVSLSLSKYFSVAAGSHGLAAYIENKETREQLMKEINADLAQFYEKAKSVFIYEPYPRLAA